MPTGESNSASETQHPRASRTDEPAETCDAFLGGTVQVRQPRRGYRAGLDAVLLAAAVPAPDPAQTLRLLDIGSGVGVVGLCAAVRLPSLDATLVEQSAELCALAERNISDNALDRRVRIIGEDVLAKSGAPNPLLPDNGFDVVVSNPPYYDAASHRRSPSHLKANSHSMPEDGLDRWLRYMARKTRPGGRAIIIHRADQLSELLAAMTPRFGAIELLPLHPRAGEPASRVLLSGIRGSRAPIRIRQGICLHGDGNRFTPEIDKVLKSPTALNPHQT